MIQIGSGHELCKLMEHRYEPMLSQVLKSIAVRGAMVIADANPGQTCLPVREVWLSLGPYSDGQVSIMAHTANAQWQYDKAGTKQCVEVVEKSREAYIAIRACDETVRIA